MRPLTIDLVRKLLQFLKHSTLILTQKFTRILSSLVKPILTFHVMKNRKHHVIVVSSWLLSYWKLRFSSTNFKIYESQRTTRRILLWITKFIPKEVLFNEFTRVIINSNKFSRSYDDLYLVGTFMRHRVHKCSKKQRQILRHINKIIFRASSCRPTFSSFFSSFFSFSSCIVAVLSHPIVTDYIIISWKKNNFNHSISR